MSSMNRMDIKKFDNKKLLWWLLQTIYTKLIGDDLKNDLMRELEDRLYPEYDGDKVRITKTGWSTPEGEISYEEEMGALATD